MAWALAPGISCLLMDILRLTKPSGELEVLGIAAQSCRYIRKTLGVSVLLRTAGKQRNSRHPH